MCSHFFTVQNAFAHIFQAHFQNAFFRIFETTVKNAKKIRFENALGKMCKNVKKCENNI